MRLEQVLGSGLSSPIDLQAPTGDSRLFIAERPGEGAAEEVKGKVQNAWGNVKDSVRGAKHDVEREADKENRDIEDDRERDIA